MCLSEGQGHQKVCHEVLARRADTCLFPHHFRKLSAHTHNLSLAVVACGVSGSRQETAIVGLLDVL